MKYVCVLCGWVYDEEHGEEDLEIEPDTKFSELPDEFECPLCYSGKEAFTEAED